MIQFIALAVGAAAAAKSSSDARSANKLATRGRKQRRAITRIQNAQRKRDFMLNFYQEQALAQASSIPLGMESSAALATQANVNTRGRRLINEAASIQARDERAQVFESRASKNAAQASQWGQVSNLAFQLYGPLSSIREVDESNV